MELRLRLYWSLLAATSFSFAVLGQDLTSTDIVVIQQRLADGASHSWEYGTRAQVLLELNVPAYSVFASAPLPPSAQVPSDLTDALGEVLGIAHAIVANRSASNGNITGAQPLIHDSAAGDPASIGVAVLLANWTGQGNVDRLDYAGAAYDQLSFLFWNVSKTPDGAISHRLDQLQLWSDSVYMVPPFLAYYGVLTGNRTLLQEAYNQVMFYRRYLRDPSANNLWKHIQLGSNGTDSGHWSTGNGWAAAGMLRVLSTIKQSGFADTMRSQQVDLANWIQEIHDGIYTQLHPSGLFHNYADDPSTFLDASSSALIASTVYRLSLVWHVYKHIPLAELCRRALAAPAGSSVNVFSSPPLSTPTSPPTTPTSTIMPSLLHLSMDGWLTPVVDPYSYSDPGVHSPEGEAFVLGMQAAWRDWVAAGSPGVNAAVRLAPRAGKNWGWGFVVMLAVDVVLFMQPW